MGRILIIILAIVLIGVLSVLALRRMGDKDRAERYNEGMKITSPVFEAGGLIPAKYTCDGDNLNPPLLFSGVPEGARSLALVVDDPDVPRGIRPDGVFNHWLIWNMPAGVSDVGEGTVPAGIEGKNTGGKAGYTGPCPPDGEHRYFFKLYALDAKLDLDPERVTKNDLYQSMEGHVLAEAELMGRYDRRR